MIFVAGEGTYVSALAAKTPEKVALVLTNYDEAGRNTEAVPVVFKNLEAGTYNFKKSYLDGRTENILNLAPVQGEIRLTGERAIIMPANSIVSLELTSSQNTK